MKIIDAIEKKNFLNKFKYLNNLQKTMFCFCFRRKCEVLRNDVDSKEPKDLTSSRTTIYPAQIKLRYD